MAIYHLHVDNISRDPAQDMPRSIVGAAAYRSRSMLYSDQDGTTYDYSEYNGNSVIAASAYRSRSKIDDFDFSQKIDLSYSEIMLPKLAPAWMSDRYKLWNHVEKVEKRIDARLARDVEMALPIELSLEKQIELVREFVTKNFVSQGMVADINIHNKENAPHAHILLSTRYVTPNGFGLKNRSWNKRSNVQLWRESWSSIANYHLAKADFDIRIDHRSFADRGIELKPQITVGTGRYVEQSDRVDKLQQILFENGNKLIKDPSIALKVLSEYSSTFTQEDILKFINGHSHHTQFNDVLAAIENCRDLVKVKGDECDIFNQFSTTELVNLETSLQLNSMLLSQSRTHTVMENHVAAAARNLSEEQHEALKRTVNGNDLAVIIGHAGTGKSYTLRSIKEAYKAQGYDVTGVALSGIAVESLESSSGIESSTIHRKLYQWENGKEKLTAKTVLVIDEAGTIGTRQMQELLAAAGNAGSKVIMVGDLNQTQAIEAGGAFRIVMDNANTISFLKQIRRQSKDWQREATRLYAGDRNDIFAALDLYAANGNVKAYTLFSAAIDGVVNDFTEDYSLKDTRLILTHTNKDVQQLNKLCREQIKRKTRILNHQDYVIEISTGKKYFCANDRILFLKNNKKLKVKNGSFATIKSIDSNGIMVVELDDNKGTVAFDIRQYNSIDHGYAATINKTQGATIDRAYFLASQGIDRHLSYVAMSRHRSDAHIYYSNDKFQNFEHLKQGFANSGLKELVSDYKAETGDLEKVLTELTAHNVLFKLDDKMEKHPQLKDHLVPIVKNADGSVSYTTDKAIEAEKQMYRSAAKLSSKTSHAFDPSGLERLSEYLFSQPNQIEAFEKTLAGGNLIVINHGNIDLSDKGYFIKSLKDVYQDSGCLVEGLSLSGLGADNLKQYGLSASTVTKKLWEWESGRNHLTAKSVLIVDNASMIGTTAMQTILKQAEDNGAKLILVGNKYLLPPVESGAPFRGLLNKQSDCNVQLRADQDSSDWRLKACQMSSGDSKSVSDALDMCAQNGAVFCLGDEQRAQEMLIFDWLKADPSSNAMIVTHQKKEAEELDLRVHDHMKQLGLIGNEDLKINGLSICTGDRIMFLKNHTGLGVRNGTVGIVRNIDGDTIQVEACDCSKQLISVNTNLYSDIKYGYAANIHKLGGIAFDSLYVYATRDMDKHSVATVFQSSRDVKFYHSFDSNFDFRRKLSRQNDKALISDYWVNPFSRKDQHSSLVELSNRFRIHSRFWSNEKDGRHVQGAYDQVVKIGGYQFAVFDTGRKDRIKTLAPYREELAQYKDCPIQYDPNTAKVTEAKEHHYEVQLMDRQSGRRYQTTMSCRIFDPKDMETARTNAVNEICRKNGLRGDIDVNFTRLTGFDAKKAIACSQNIQPRNTLSRGR